MIRKTKVNRDKDKILRLYRSLVRPQVGILHQTMESIAEQNMENWRKLEEELEKWFLATVLAMKKG